MKKQTLIILAIVLVVVTIAYFATRSPEKNSVISDTPTISNYDIVDNSSKKSDSICSCSESWFKNGVVLPPIEEGPKSPFHNNITVSNCNFHQWSWQKFLWLTQLQPNGKTLFENDLINVTSNMIPIPAYQGNSLVLESVEQAAFNAILVSNPNFNKKADTVYYSIHVDSTLKSSTNTFAQQIVDGSLSRTNTKTFPVGALELKVSWIKASSIPSNLLSSYYTTQAVLKNGTEYSTETMALLGMHVVGIVENHPEFIWATFEHKKMAPKYDWNTQKVASAKETLFFKADTTTSINGIIWDTTTKKPVIQNQVYSLFKYGVPRTVGNKFMPTSQKEPLNFTNIETINASVDTTITSIWKNYFYNGSIWLNTEDYKTTERQAQLIDSLGYSISSVIPGALTRGSTNAFNITMETFEQTFEKSFEDIHNSNLANCFSCHSSKNFYNSNYKSPLYLSHIFEGYLHKLDGKTNEEIEIMKDKDFDRLFLKKK